MGSNPSHNRRMPWSSGILACLAVLLPAAASWAAETAPTPPKIAVRVEAIRKAGDPVTLKELDASYPSVPDHENAALVFDQALKLSREDPLLVKRLPMVGMGKMPPLEAPLPENVRKDMTAFLAANKQALELLRQSARMGRCRFPVDLTRGFEAQLPHLASVRKACRHLYLEAAAAIEQGDAERAVCAVASSLGLARLPRNEPILISRLVRIACTKITLDAPGRVLSRGALTDAQLRRLSAAIEKEAQQENALRSIMAAERCIGISLFEQPDMVRQLVGQHAKQPLPKWWRPEDDYGIYLDIMGAYVETSAKPWPARLAAAKAVQRRVNALTNRYVIPRLLLPAMERVFVQEGTHAARLRCALTGLAIERYRVKHGKLPRSLDALPPKFIAAVPADPFDGKPLRYTTIAPGYMVYSIGPDQRDDGGLDVENDPTAGDLPFDVAR